jgi:hypothetical protein
VNSGAPEGRAVPAAQGKKPNKKHREKNLTKNTGKKT